MTPAPVPTVESEVFLIKNMIIYSSVILALTNSSPTCMAARAARPGITPNKYKKPSRIILETHISIGHNKYEQYMIENHPYMNTQARWIVQAKRLNSITELVSSCSWLNQSSGKSPQNPRKSTTISGNSLKIHENPRILVIFVAVFHSSWDPGTPSQLSGIRTIGTAGTVGSEHFVSSTAVSAWPCNEKNMGIINDLINLITLITLISLIMDSQKTLRKLWIEMDGVLRIVFSRPGIRRNEVGYHCSGSTADHGNLCPRDATQQPETVDVSPYRNLFFDISSTYAIESYQRKPQMYNIHIYQKNTSMSIHCTYQYVYAYVYIYVYIYIYE